MFQVYINKQKLEHDMKYRHAEAHINHLQMTDYSSDG
jgi:tRNA(His) 5'-end guanylyltransferase